MTRRCTYSNKKQTVPLQEKESKIWSWLFLVIIGINKRICKYIYICESKRSSNHFAHITWNRNMELLIQALPLSLCASQQTYRYHPVSAPGRHTHIELVGVQALVIRYQSFKNVTGWWFQPIWKILVISQTGSFPKYEWKSRNIWNHHRG